MYLFIEERSPETVKEYNDKLVARVHELLGDVSLDENRILQEVAVYADKVAGSCRRNRKIAFSY